MAGRVPHVSMRGTLSRLNWRVTLVQFLANAIVIGLLILLLPGFELHATHELLAVLWLAAVFGVITALVRPALEFLFLPYVLQSLGLVMVAINAILLALLGLTSVLEINGVVPLADRRRRRRSGRVLPRQRPRSHAAGAGRRVRAGCA